MCGFGFDSSGLRFDPVVSFVNTIFMCNLIIRVTVTSGWRDLQALSLIRDWVK
jgi:hypothetical protein